METKKPLVVLTHRLPADWLAALEGKCELVSGAADAERITPEVMPEIIRADGLMTTLSDRIDAAVIEQAVNLRVISNMAAGVDNIDLDACTKRKIAVGNTPGILTDSVADLTMALLLSLVRQLPQAAKDARTGNWKTWAPAGWLGMELNGAILGVVGMGKIGAAVARRAKAFGMKIIYTSRSTHTEIERELNAEFRSLDKLLAESDVVSLHTPLTPETRGMIDEAALRKMKPGAFLINMARGVVVDSEALYRALSEGWIAGAGLDVTAPEPLPPEHPLYRLDNCLILPHIGSATCQTRRKMAQMACENLLAGLQGQRMPYCANPTVYEMM